MRRYHHIGIPTDVPKPGEIYLEHLGLHCTDHASNAFGIQWMRYDSDSRLPELVKSLPHVAFEVDDLVQELEGHRVLIEPNSPSEGVTVAFIVHDGAPVELLQIDRSRPGAAAGCSGGVDWRPPEGGGGEEV